MEGKMRRANTNCRSALLTHPALRAVVVGTNRREKQNNAFLLLKWLWLPGILFLSSVLVEFIPKAGKLAMRLPLAKLLG